MRYTIYSEFGCLCLPFAASRVQGAFNNGVWIHECLYWAEVFTTWACRFIHHMRGSATELPILEYSWRHVVWHIRDEMNVWITQCGTNFYQKYISGGSTWWPTWYQQYGSISSAFINYIKFSFASIGLLGIANENSNTQSRCTMARNTPGSHPSGKWNFIRLRQNKYSELNMCVDVPHVRKHNFVLSSQAHALKWTQIQIPTVTQICQAANGRSFNQITDITQHSIYLVFVSVFSVGRNIQCESIEYRRVCDSIRISSLRFLSHRWDEITDRKSWTSRIRWTNSTCAIQSGIHEGSAMWKGNLVSMFSE